MLNQAQPNPRNPFGIPDVSPLKAAVEAFVKKYQGHDGYIDTQDDALDTIWGYLYGHDQVVHEYQVKAVRVNPHSGNLECILDGTDTDWNEEAFREAIKADELDSADSPWEDIQYGDVMFVQTMFNIAEAIEEYVTVKICVALEGEDISDAPDILRQFGKVSFCDEKIDNGCDDEEDEYVMMRSYDVEEFYVRIYYGNNTRIISCVDAERRR